MSGTYFAAEPASSIASVLFAKIEAWYERQRSSGRYDRIMKSWAMAHGVSVDNGSVSWAMTRGGAQGEIIKGHENHYRSIGTNLVNLTTAERPAIQCSAANSDYRTLAQAKLANGLADYHLTERSLETLLKRACKSGVFRSEGFILGEWDPNAGEPHATNQDGGVVKTGAPRFAFGGPFDVIRDDYASSFDSLTWLIFRDWANKYELAAQYPELADSIISLGFGHDLFGAFKPSGGNGDETDLIPVFKFFHDRNPALEEGRQTTILNASILLFDGPLVYRKKPIAYVMPDETDGTPYGNTPMFDLMGPQEAVNGLDSATITNNLGRGIGNILEPTGSNMSVSPIGTSMNSIKYTPVGGQKPEAFIWPPTPPELYAAKDKKIAAMETLSGVSSVNRGNPSASVGADASGAKLALIQATSIHNNSGLQNSYVQCVRDVVMLIVQLYRDLGGQVPRLARLAGKNKEYMVKEFTAEDLADIDRVTVDLGNPIMRTTGGKMQMAEWALQYKLIPEGQIKQLLELVKSGTVEPAFEAGEAMLMRIRGENERLMRGDQIRAIIADPHWLEIPEHLTILDNPSMRDGSPEAEQIATAVLAHVQEHLEFWRTMDPALIQIRGGQPAPMPAMPGMTAPPLPGTENGTPAPPGGPGSATPPPMNPDASKPDLPGMPSMPRNPMNGEPAHLPGVPQ